MLAAEYKMPESEFRARFTENEIARIHLLNSARAEAHKIRYPDNK